MNKLGAKVTTEKGVEQQMPSILLESQIIDVYQKYKGKKDMDIALCEAQRSVDAEWCNRHSAKLIDRLLVNFKRLRGAEWMVTADWCQPGARDLLLFEIDSIIDEYGQLISDSSIVRSKKR